MSKDWILESFRRNEPLHSHVQIHHTCKGGAPGGCFHCASNLSCNLVTCSHCAWTTSSAQSRTSLTSSGLTWWMSSCCSFWGLDLSFRSAASFPSSMPARFKAWTCRNCRIFELKRPCKSLRFLTPTSFSANNSVSTAWLMEAPCSSHKLQAATTKHVERRISCNLQALHLTLEREVKNGQSMPIYADLFHSEIQWLGWISRCWNKTRCSWKSTSWASFRYVTELGEIETTPWMGWTDMVGTEDDKIMFEHASSGPKLHTNLPSPKSLLSNQNWKGHGPGSLVQSCLVK